MPNPILQKYGITLEEDEPERNPILEKYGITLDEPLTLPGPEELAAEPRPTGLQPPSLTLEPPSDPIITTKTGFKLRLPQAPSIAQEPEDIIDPGQTKGAKRFTAPIKGIQHVIESAPQVIGSLIEEFGARMEKEPEYWQANTVTGAYYLTRQALNEVAKRTDFDERIAAFGKKMVKDNEAKIKAKGILPTGEDTVENFLFNLGSGATTLGAAVGLSLVTKSPHAAAVMFGVYQKGQLYKEATEAGVDPEKAGQLSTLGGAVEGGLEYIGLKFLLKAYTGRALSAIIRSGTEAIQEATQTFGENLLVKFGFDKSRELSQGVGESALIGAILGVPASIAISKFEHSQSADILREAGIDPASTEGKSLIGKIIESQRAGIERLITSEAGFAQIGEGEMPEELARVRGEESLAQEAKKYKTADEFVAAQEKFYHGTPSKFKEFLTPQEMPEEIAEEVLGVPSETFGVYFTTSKELASEFGKNIIETSLDIKKPLDLTSVKSFDDLVGMLPIDKKANDWELRNMVRNSYYDKLKPTDSFYKPLEDLITKFDLLPELKKMGYDAIVFNDKENAVKGITTIALDKSQIKTKSQLTAIWQKAQKPAVKPVEKPAPKPKPAVAGKSELAALKAQLRKAEKRPEAERIAKEIEQKLKPKISRLELERKARVRVATVRAEKKVTVIEERVKKKEAMRRLIVEHKVEALKKEKVVGEEIRLLKTRLWAEKKLAVTGKRVARVETRKKIYKQIQAKATEVADVKRSMVEYAKEHLSTKDRGKLLSRVEKVHTKRGLTRGMQMIDVMEERYWRHVEADNLKRTIKGIDFKRLRPEYKAPIEGLAKSLDLVGRRESTLDGLRRMADFIEQNPDHNIPEKHLRKLDRLSRTPIKSLTTADIVLINNSIEHLVKLQDLKNKLLIKGKVREFKQARDEAVTNLKKKDPAIVDPREGVRVSMAKQFFTLDSLNVEHITTEQLDKADKGMNKAVFYDGIDEGVTEVMRYGQEAEDFFGKEIGDILRSDDYLKWDEAFWTKKKRAKNVDYQSYKLDSGQTLKITKEERITIDLDSRNENNLRRMLEGGYRLRSNPAILYTISTADLDTILATMTEQENKVADVRHKYYNTVQKDKLNEKSKKLNGWEVATEADYFPMADRIYGVDVHKDYLLKGESLPTNMRQFTQSTMESMGMFKERVPNTNPLILESAAVITFKSIKQAGTYVGLAQPLRTAKALLFDSEYRHTLISRYGAPYWQALHNYLRDVEGEYQRTDNVDKLVASWINRLDVAVLGLNPFVMLKQPVSLLAAATEMDSEYLIKALGHKPASVEKMSANSPQLRDRFGGNVTRELGEIAQTGQARQFWTKKQSLSQNLMKGIRNFDFQAIGRIWNAVEAETKALHPALKDDAYLKHVAARTEEVVRLTQPTFHTKDRSAIGRSKQIFTRLWTKYSSQRNKNYMMLYRAIKRYNRSSKGTKAKGKFMKDMAILSLLMPLLIYGIDELRNLAYKRKRKKPERRVRYGIFKWLDNMLGNVYGVGPVFRSLTSKIEYGTYAGHDVSDVFTSSAETGIDAVAETIRAIDQVISKEKFKAGDKRGELKWKASAKKAADQAISFGTRFKGIPYDTVKRLLLIPFKHIQPEKKKTTTKRNPILDKYGIKQ